MNKKTCCTCGKTKPIELFEKTKRIKSGYTTRCKTCKNATTTKAYKAYYRMVEKQPKFPIPIETDYEEVKQIFDMFENRCAYCSVIESERTGTFHLEHVRALSNGGRHVAWNLVISCKKCNSKKQNKPLIEFYRMHEPFHGIRLDFIFMYVARFSGRPAEEVASEFYTEVEDDEQT